MMDLGSYDYVQQVYNNNIRLLQYHLPRTMVDGTTTVFDDGLLSLTMAVENQRVVKIIIRTTDPKSEAYMTTFEGFEFGFDAVATWIQNYRESTSNHGHSEGTVKGILAVYDTNNNNELTVVLTRVSEESDGKKRA